MEAPDKFILLPQKSKRQLSQKQLDALARGREKLLQKNRLKRIAKLSKTLQETNLPPENQEQVMSILAPNIVIVPKQQKPNIVIVPKQEEPNVMSLPDLPKQVEPNILMSLPDPEEPLAPLPKQDEPQVEVNPISEIEDELKKRIGDNKILLLSVPIVAILGIFAYKYFSKPLKKIIPTKKDV